MDGDDGRTDDRERFDADEGTRRSRWIGVVGLSVARVWTRATRTRSGRTAATVAAVAVTIALLVVVTGVALGLADGDVTGDTDADVRVTSASSGPLATVDGVEEPRLGSANERAAAVGEREGIDHASPTLSEPMRLASVDGESATILVVGVVPDGENRTVAGLPTTDLEAGDDHYADGDYDGPTNGEVVLSRAAADRLEASAGEELAVETTWTEAEDGADAPTVTVAAVTAAEDDESPVALAHLSELQSATGADGGELADGLSLWGDADAGADAASEAYPDAVVEVDGGVSPSALFDDELAFATSLLALVVGVTICTSLVATTAGMTVNEDRRTLAVLETIGYPGRSRLAIVGATTLATTIAGAAVGVVLGVLGIVALNVVATATVAGGAVAAVHPLFVPYALGVAVLSGVLAVPYPLAVAARTPVLEEVSR